MHTNYGDYAVTEAPTYYLAHQMFKERGLNLLEVPIESDGMDMEALEKLCLEQEGKIKVVYTVPVHHNPTGITMSNEKREKLAALAKKFKFYVIADEAYQLVNFKPTGVLPLFYHDDPSDPRIFSVGTFSKVIGPGLKVGWIQAAKELLDPIANIGFINSGNNPVTFSSCVLTNFVKSGALKEHLEFVKKDLGRKCHLLATELEKAGLDVVEPSGGYLYVHIYIIYHAFIVVLVVCGEDELTRVVIVQHMGEKQRWQNDGKIRKRHGAGEGGVL